MLIDARAGNTSRDFKPKTAAGALAHVIDALEIGQHVEVSDLIKKDGTKVGPFKVQAMIPVMRDSSKKYTTRIADGVLTIRRLA